MADVRIYNLALADVQIQQLTAQAPAEARENSSDESSKKAIFYRRPNASRVDKFAADELKRYLAAARKMGRNHLRSQCCAIQRAGVLHRHSYVGNHTQKVVPQLTARKSRH